MRAGHAARGIADVLDHVRDADEASEHAEHGSDRWHVDEDVARRCAFPAGL